jgi:hypothetical protein
MYRCALENASTSQVRASSRWAEATLVTGRAADLKPGYACRSAI